MPPWASLAAGAACSRPLHVPRSRLLPARHLMQNAADAAEPPSWTLVINGRLLGKASEAGERFVPQGMHDQPG